MKALVFDEKNRLLVFRDGKDGWEMPGGGWEFGESLEECVTRELEEEARAVATEIGDVSFIYHSPHEKGFNKLCVAVPVVLGDEELVPTGDDLVEIRYVTKDEFLELKFEPNEQAVLQYVDKIWSSK